MNGTESAARSAPFRSFLTDERIRLAMLVAVAAFLLDWATKSWALRHLEDAAVPLGALVLGIERNSAFAFSSGSDVVSPWLVIAVRVAALAVLAVVCLRVGATNHRYASGFALLLGGGSGNTADMAFRQGAVVDFIGAGPIAFDWAGETLLLHVFFNTADLAILIGLGLIAPQIRSMALGVHRWLAEAASDRAIPRAIEPPPID